MTTILLVIHIAVAVTMIILILLQRSEGGALGIGGGGNMMGSRAIASGLTRVTAILATIFFLTSITLTLLNTVSQESSVLDGVIERPEGAPAPSPILPSPLSVPELPTP